MARCSGIPQRERANLLLLQYRLVLSRKLLG
jgi:hypothetical protein